MTVELTLPYPPSKNHLDYNQRMTSRRTGREFVGRAFTPEYRQYKSDVYREVRRQRGPGAPMILSDVAVSIDVYPPDLRVRDLFNILESLSDALTYSKVWKNDKQIRRSDRIEFFHPWPNGKVVVRIEEINTLFASVA